MLLFAHFTSFPFQLFSTENLLQNSRDDSWTDSNLNRVSVIQFQEETKAEEEDDDEDRRVRNYNFDVVVFKQFTPSSWILLIFHNVEAKLQCIKQC